MFARKIGTHYTVSSLKRQQKIEVFGSAQKYSQALYKFISIETARSRTASKDTSIWTANPY